MRAPLARETADAEQVESAAERRFLYFGSEVPLSRQREKERERASGAQQGDCLSANAPREAFCGNHRNLGATLGSRERASYQRGYRPSGLSTFVTSLASVSKESDERSPSRAETRRDDDNSSAPARD